MNTTKLPPLPEPHCEPSYHTDGIALFTDDQMHAYALAAINEHAKWAHHAPRLLTEADAAADLAGVARPACERVEDSGEQDKLEQLPVGWFESPYGAFRANPMHKIHMPSALLDWQVPLYITPPRRGPLTDEQIEEIITNHNYRIHGDRPRYIARATEAAHGIGAQKGKP